MRKTTSKWKRVYFKYLTERLDSGESKNIVVPTAVNIICKKLKFQKKIKVLDIGCFSGAMLNRIRLNLPDGFKNRVSFIGVDKDKKVLMMGVNRYQNIIFISSDFEKDIPLVSQYDIIIFSNVLHEISSKAKSNKNRKNIVNALIKKIRGLLCTDGNLVILDGLKPKRSNRNVVVKFATSTSCNRYKLFARRYNAIPIQAERISKNKIKTKIGHLAAFLTKARYLNKEYWKNESKQLYQYFTVDEFEELIAANKMVVEKIEPQMFSKNQINKIIDSVDPKIELPAKNILIVAKKHSHPC